MPIGENALLLVFVTTVLWGVSVVRRDASIVDPWWSMLFLLVTANTVRHAGLTPSNGVLLCMVAVWAVRLWVHLLVRSRGRPEDPRYAGFRRKYGAERYWWVSYFQVFLVQGVLALVISMPLQVAAWAGEIAMPFMMGGLVVFVAGLSIEVVADAQLQSFRTNAARRGGVLDRGLWRYSRHPNYFGEAVLWWGLWVVSAGAPDGWATVFSPLLMTFLLVRVSGVTMLDAHMVRTKPMYAEYMRRTSSFVPWRRG